MILFLIKSSQSLPLLLLSKPQEMFIVLIL